MTFRMPFFTAIWKKQSICFSLPDSFDATKPDHVCRLNRSIYGLRQAPRACNQRFVEFITKQGFKQSKSDASLFIYLKNGERAYLLLYVDDIILTASSSSLRKSVVDAMKSEFPITDEGQINSFLDISTLLTTRGCS